MQIFSKYNPLENKQVIYNYMELWAGIKFLSCHFFFTITILQPDRYQIAQGMLPETHPWTLYHMMHIFQWDCAEILVWVIIILLLNRCISFFPSHLERWSRMKPPTWLEVFSTVNFFNLLQDCWNHFQGKRIWWMLKYYSLLDHLSPDKSYVEQE